MPVPNIFANATATIPLSQLDANFATAITLGNTAIQLGNTVSTLNNMTLANVTVSSVSTPITVPQGGTGVATLGANNVILGNATSAVKEVAPGTTGNVLTSDGTTWISQAAGAATGNVTIGNTTISLGGTTTSLGNVTLNNATIGDAVANSANVAGFIGIPQNSQNGNYNVLLGDAGKHIYHPTGQAAATYTFPANSNVSFTVGSAVTIINGSANNVTIALTTDTLYLSSNGATGSRTLTQWGVATAVKITNTSWVISGSNLT